MHPLAKKYEANRQLYVDLTEFAIAHLNKCLADQDLKHMKTESRTKEIPSLNKKVSDPKFSVSKIQDIHDLSAVRAITLLEKQSAVIVSRLRDYFGWKNCVYTPKYAVDGYNADHLVVTVPASFTRKKKDKKFTGLKFEVQVVSILYSVWAQLGHDLVYKDELKIKEFNPDFHLSLETKFKDLMQNHLKPLTDELDVIDSMVFAQVRGRNVQDSSPLKNLSQQSDAKILSSGIRELKETLSAIGNRTSSEYPLESFMEDIILKIKSGNISPSSQHSVETTVSDVVSALVDLFLYIDSKSLPKSIELLLTLEKYTTTPWASKSIKDCLSQISHLNPNVYRTHGFQIYDSVLTVILNEIKNFGFTEFSKLLWKNIVRLQFELSRFDGNSFHITHGIPEITDDLVNLRKRAVLELFNLYPSLKLDSKLGIINSQGECYQSFSRTSVPDKAVAEIENTMVLIVDELKKLIVSNISVVELERIERHVDLIQRRFSKKASKPAKSLKKQLSKDKDYKLYREVAAYETDFIAGSLKPDMQTSFDTFIQKKAKTEKQFHKLLIKITSFMETIQSTQEEGRSRVAMCMFLEYAASKKSSWVKTYLNNHSSNVFGLFEYPILLGLYNVGEKEFSNQFCLQQIPAHALEVSILLHAKMSYSTSLWDACFSWVKNSKDKAAINTLIYSILSHETDDKIRVKNLRKILSFAISEKHDLYILNPYHSFEENFKKLNAKDIKLFVKLILNKKSLEFNEDTLIGWVADIAPELVIWFFEERIKIEEKWEERSGLFKTYRAVPHDLYWLEHSSISSSVASLHKVLSWAYKSGEHVHCATKLINMLWVSEKEEILKYASNKAIQSSTDKKKRNVFSFIRHINNSSLHIEFAEAFINAHKNWRDFEGDLSILVGYEGIVHGEEGFLNMHQASIDFANTRKSQTKGDVKSFWAKIGSSTKKDKSLEHRRVDKERTRKRLIYGK